MASLSKADEKFLLKHGIGVEETFDGAGMTVKEIRDHMKAYGLLIAFGKRCPRGHAIRAAGGCVRCNTAYIAFALRSRRWGYVYVAKSASRNLLKVGFSTDPQDRIYIANLEGYGNASDWQIRYMVAADNAARIESTVKSALVLHREYVDWVRNGDWTIATETFRCPLAQAHRILISQLDDDQIPSIKYYWAN